MRYLAAYGASALALLVLDAVWLTTMADRLYRPVLGDWMVTKVNLAPAVIFYLLFLAGLTFLATIPGLKEGSVTRVIINAAVFGFVAYATYDLTNQATLVRWSPIITIVDMAWGTFLSVSGAVAGYYAARLVPA